MPIERVELEASYRYVPSPFDNFGGPTNLLDNDSHAVSVGANLRLGHIPESDVLMTLRWATRTTLFVEREEHKDFRRFPNDYLYLTNVGQRPYAYGGGVTSGSLSLEASW